MTKKKSKSLFISEAKTTNLWHFVALILGNRVRHFFILVHYLHLALVAFYRIKYSFCFVSGVLVRMIGSDDYRFMLGNVYLFGICAMCSDLIVSYRLVFVPLFHYLFFLRHHIKFSCHSVNFLAVIGYKYILRIHIVSPDNMDRKIENPILRR